MVNTVIKSVGPGRDHATLSAFAAALPADLVAADQSWVAELHDGAEDPGGALVQCTCDATRFVTIRAAPGLGFADRLNPAVDPLVPTSGKGALVRAVNGAALTVQGAATRVAVRGLQIIAQGGGALADDGAGRFVKVERCLLDANSTSAAVAVRGTGSVISDSAVIQRGTGDGIALVAGAEARNCTVVKPAATIARGVGIAPSGSPAPSVRAVAAFGYGRAFGTGIGTADALAADQVNVLPAPNNFADPSWTVVGASVNAADTIPGPYSVPLQKLGNNTNAFARFDSPVFTSVPVGKRVAFSVIVAQPTSLISAIAISSSAGVPEIRVDWRPATPLVTLFGQASALKLVTGTLTNLGNATWRLLVEAQNTSASAVDVLARFYVTRGTENAGLSVGMYAGALMAGIGHVGTGFVAGGAAPGTNAIAGVVPTAAIVSATAPGLDLRPVAGGPLAGAASVIGPSDVFLRYRLAPDTIGAMSLNTAPWLAPKDIVASTVIDRVRAIDRNDILSAHRRRTMLPAAPLRRVGV